MSGKLTIGTGTLYCMGLGLMLTGTVYWLGFIALDLLSTAVLFFFILPIVGLAFLALLGGVSIGRGSALKVGGTALLLMLYMFIDALLLETIVPQSILDAVSSGIVGFMAILLVQMLFAIYEETFFTATAGFMKAARAPDILVILLSMAIFTWLHWNRYPMNLFYTLFLSISRGFLTGAMLKVDNSDVNFYAHLGFNILMSVF